MEQFNLTLPSVTVFFFKFWFIYIYWALRVRINPHTNSFFFFFFSFFRWGEMIDDEFGAVGGMRIGRRNRSNRRTPASTTLCPPQIPHHFSWDQTRVAAVGRQRLTAWAMARPIERLSKLLKDCLIGSLKSLKCLAFRKIADSASLYLVAISECSGMRLPTPC
jgi:hypothetical protein